mmetsp:Transcript_14453/g.16165  ORF Transcript_14453/g.16165 Transcript_14453/m.16165 type:complete len:170 (+) Transcript_14453:70-579(+)
MSAGQVGLDLVGEEAKDEDFIFTGQEGTPEDARFDEIVGALEGLLMDPSFCEFQDKFRSKHCDEFEDTEENKLSYMTIFQDYVKVVEDLVEKALTAAVDNFSMDEFLQMCETREDQINGDVFELLTQMGDFSTFKAEMLNFKEQHAKGFEPWGGLSIMPVAKKKKQFGL